MEDTCTSSDCPVHFRNDYKSVSEYGYPWMITYVGEYAVFSDTGRNRNVHPDDNLKVAAQAALLILSGADDATVDEFTDSVLEGFTYIYKVNHGAISDSEDYGSGGSEKYYSKPGDNEERHQIAVDMVTKRQEV